ncbi:hypothetical protein [Actinomadura sp. WMMA1423]|uniref:hypothetical protein n=1 Tax=Actinomadura sp. WMMA1423 TaxID=2591108 RepID=UPI001146E3E2|nr:hypothetical protein [Actinomadura sp. WMMA1423]
MQAKDGMLLVTYANVDCTISSPAGWLPAKAQQSPETDGITAAVWKRVAGVSDPGATLTITNDGTSPKAGAVLLAYSGVDLTDIVHKINSRLDTGGTASVPTPQVTTTIGDCRVVEVCVDKSTSTTQFTARPAGSTSRATVIGTGGGHPDISAVERAATTAGNYGGGTFTLDANQSSAITYTIALAPKLNVQTARPQSDVTIGGYTAEPTVGTGVPLAARIGEAARDDATYLRSPAGPTSAVYEARLNAVEDPGVDTGFSFTVVLSSGGGATSAQCEVALVQGTTVISSTTFTDLPATPTVYTLNVTALEAANINDFGDLRLRFTSTAS